VFRAAVVGLDHFPPSIEFRVTGDYSKTQRRSTFRVRENLPVKALRISNEPAEIWVDTTTADISESGVLLRYNSSCAAGQPIKLTIHINKFGMDVVLPTVRGRVVRCVAARNKDFGYLLGIKFENLPERARNEIIRFVVLSQRSGLQDTHFKRYRKNG
jgi:c-di-GMP-binding flagellar brake protein YcgR